MEPPGIDRMVVNGKLRTESSRAGKEIIQASRVAMRCAIEERPSESKAQINLSFCQRINNVARCSPSNIVAKKIKRKVYFFSRNLRVQSRIGMNTFVT